MRKIGAEVNSEQTKAMLEDMASAMLSKILPALAIMFVFVLASQIVFGSKMVEILPTAFSLLFYLLASVISRRGRSLFAARMMITILLVGLLAVVATNKSLSHQNGIVVSSILICWVCWFTPRYVNAVFLIVLMLSFMLMTILNIKGIVVERPTSSPMAEILVVPFMLALLYLSIRSPFELLMKSVTKSRHSEALASRALEELKQSRSFTIQAVDQSRHFFGWLTPDGILQYSNSRFLEVIDKSAADIVGKPFWETPWFSHSTGEVARLRDAIDKVRKGESLEYDLVIENGLKGIREVNFSLHPIFDDSDVVTMIVAEGHDLTNERETIREKEMLMEQFHQMQKMDAIGRLAGGIAHDINNALSGIIGGAELLQGSGLSEEQGRNYANMILNAADRAGDLAKKLLVFSRKGNKTTQPVDVLNIVKDTAVILGSTIDKRISIVTDNSATKAVVMGDDALLQSVLLNLGINAGHAMPEGGTLTFELSNTVLDDDYCRHSTFDLSAGEFLQLSVRDTGCGMIPEIQSRIFEPFFTTKERGEGTGLGLSAVYGIIQDHHGAITIYSEPERGTVFHIYLPLSESQVPEQHEQILERGNGTILIVDDEELIRVTASAILTSLGYHVLTAENGQVGVSLYKEHRDEIGLVILDMIMPVMGGRETFRNIRLETPSIPIIVASGYAREEDEKLMREEGASAFLAKPYRKIDLATKVAELMTSGNQSA